MNAIDYAFDVLRQKHFATFDFCFTLQIRKYCLNGKNELITGCIVRVPILSDFARIPYDYEKLCIRYEQRFSSKLSPDIMMHKLEIILGERFLQEKINIDYPSTSSTN